MKLTHFIYLQLTIRWQIKHCTVIYSAANNNFWNWNWIFFAAKKSLYLGPQSPYQKLQISQFEPKKRSHVCDNDDAFDCVAVLHYTSGRNTLKFGLETTLSIQESSKVKLVQSLSNQWKVLDTVTVKCLWSVSQPHLESVTGALKITIATCTFFICNRLHKNV